jgi:hypothetical protein
VFGRNNLQLLAYAKFYTAEFDLAFLFFFACLGGPAQKMNQKRACPRAKNPTVRRCDASTRKAYTPLAGFLGPPA